MACYLYYKRNWRLKTCREFLSKCYFYSRRNPFLSVRKHIQPGPCPAADMSHRNLWRMSTRTLISFDGRYSHVHVCMYELLFGLEIPPRHKTNTCKIKFIWINFRANACRACIRKRANTGKYFWETLFRAFFGQILGGIHFGANTCRTCIRTRANISNTGKILANYLCVWFRARGHAVIKDHNQWKIPRLPWQEWCFCVYDTLCTSCFSAFWCAITTCWELLSVARDIFSKIPQACNATHTEHHTCITHK